MLKNRIILAVLWVISLIGISFYGGPVSYGFFTVITLIPVISLIYLLIVLARFKMYQYFECPGIVCNHTVPFYFTLQNEDIFTYAGVRVKFYSDYSVIDGVNDDIEYELLPHTRIKKETSMLCRYRGEYEVGIRTVELRDFFCLFRITYKNREPMKVNVLPDMITVDSIAAIDEDFISDRSRSRASDRPDLTVRDYIPGDDIRRINWRQTARLNKLLVREMTGEENEGIGLIVDNVRISDERSKYLPVENRVLETAIALALMFNNKNIPVEAYYRSGDVVRMPVDGADSFQGLYDAMSALVFDPSEDNYRLYEELLSFDTLFSKSLVFLITASLNDVSLDFLRRLGNGGSEVVVYLVDDMIDESSEETMFPHVRVVTVPSGGDLAKLLQQRG